MFAIRDRKRHAWSHENTPESHSDDGFGRGATRTQFYNPIFLLDAVVDG